MIGLFDASAFPVRFAGVVKGFDPASLPCARAAKRMDRFSQFAVHAAIESVRDSGLGIPRDMLGKVFELFTQVDRTLEKAQGCLGIGLTLVRRLTEMHGGSVEAKSEGYGRGIEFIVRLPAAPQIVSISLAAGVNQA